MNIIKKLGKNNENLQAILNVYREDIEAARERLALKGKTLGQANKDQIAWLTVYDESRVELRTMVKHFQAQVDKVRGELFRQYTDFPSKELSERTKEKYIDHDPKFLDANDILLEVEEVYEKFCAIVETYKARGFALRNLTELNVHQLMDTPL